MASNIDLSVGGVTPASPDQYAGKSPVLQKRTWKSKAKTKAEGPKIGPKPRRPTGVEELKQTAKERFRHHKATPETNGSSNAIHMYVPEEATQYIEIDDKKGEFSVEEFVHLFSDHLPMQVYVSKGVYGMEDKYSLSTEDVCNIHFARQRESVRVEEDERQLKLSVPINSAIKFAIVYNPQNNSNEAMKGYLFPNVSDLLSLGYGSLPKIVCACQFHDLEHPNAEPGQEIMVIKDVILPDDPNESRKLRVFSISSLKERLLDENVYGHFSTRPSFMQMYLPDLLKYVPNPIPSQVAMFRNPMKNVAPGVPSSMFRTVMNMTRKQTSMILIATNILDQRPVESVEPFEIPTDIDVEFQVVKLPEERVKWLEKNTEYLAKNMDESKVKHYRYVNVSDEIHRLQSAVYLAVRGRGQPEDDPDYVHPVTGSRLSIDKRVELVEKGLKKVSNNIENVKLDIGRQEGQNDYNKAWFHAIEQKFTKELQQIRNDVAALKHKIAFREATASPDAVKENREDKSTDDGRMSAQNDHELRNKQLLARMDVKQVVSLLEVVGLGAYAEIVKSECITGEILQEVDDGVLENELGIQSKLHRVKMRRLIDGKFPSHVYYTTTK